MSKEFQQNEIRFCPLCNKRYQANIFSSENKCYDCQLEAIGKLKDESQKL